MKKTFLMLSLIFFSIQSFSQDFEGASKINVKINKNVELLGLAYFIGFEGVDIEEKTVEVDGKTIPKKVWHNYGFKIYEQYKPFASSENLAECFMVADHLWLDYLNAFLLQVEDVPNAKLTSDIEEAYFINFSKKKDIIEAKKNAEIFLEGLNAFAKEINFESYLSDSKGYYDKVIEEVENELPKNDFIQVMESYYREKFDNYLLVPSLTTPKGMGFGIRYSSNDKTTVVNVFGALDYQEFKDMNDLKMGFANQEKVRELSVHEFGHSFVNPVVAQLPDTIFKETEKLFPLLKSAMAEQGYNTWKVCVYEHFTRAGEIVIAEKMGMKSEASKLLLNYQEKRQFKYLPEILVELRKYDKGEYASYYEAVEVAMRKLSKY